MEKMNMHTPDLAKENYEKLAALFPNAVTETKDENGETCLLYTSPSPRD